MIIPEIKYCPGTLSEGFDTYSPIFLKRMFKGQKVSHILPFPSSPQQENLINNRKYLSISGVQLKYSLKLESKILRLTNKDERGEYIIKPSFNEPNFTRPDMIPANEHLTMQIARQVYDIVTAENGMIFFQDGIPAYITRRFDIKPDGTKYRQEDFASILGRTNANNDEEYKYNASYLEIGQAIQQYVGAAKSEIDKFFRVILFNYIFSNGDAHLKNFSLLESADGDYILSPAYDLVCSRIHVNDHEVGLHDGLYAGDIDDNSYKQYGSYCYDNFYDLGEKLGMAKPRIEKILEKFCAKQEKVETFIERSFLDEEIKEQYRKLHEERLKKINTSLRPQIEQITLNGLEEIELKNLSGKTIHFQNIEIPGMDSANFNLRYRLTNSAGHEIISPIVFNVFKDKSNVVLNNYVNVPLGYTLYVKLVSAPYPIFQGKGRLQYGILKS